MSKKNSSRCRPPCTGILFPLRLSVAVYAHKNSVLFLFAQSPPIIKPFCVKYNCTVPFFWINLSGYSLSFCAEDAHQIIFRKSKFYQFRHSHNWFWIFQYYYLPTVYSCNVFL